MRRSLLGLALLLWAASPGVGQERVRATAEENTEEELLEEEELDPDLPPISYEATLRVGFQDIVLPAMESPFGPLFLLEPIVATLGGELREGPLKESHDFTVRDAQVILGTTSTVLMIDQEMERLSRVPVLSQLGLVVSQEVLDKTYGELLGIGFDWDEGSRVLQMRRREPRTIQVAIDAVELQGTSTIVLEFDTRPDYAVRHRRRSVTIDVGNDQIEMLPSAGRQSGALVDTIEISDNSIRLVLDEGAEAAEPYELRSQRFGSDGMRLVFDVSLGSARVEDRPATGPAIPSRRLPRTIVIDPGHGGTETGAIGTSGTYEKDLTLAIARALRDKITARLPVRVVLTRNSDITIPLATRTAVANENRAELFLSIHLNSSRTSRATGAETFFLSLQASDEQSARLAEEENLEPEEEGSEEPVDEDELGLELMLWDLAQTQHLADSQKLATFVQTELNTALQLRDRGVRQAPFSVLMGASMPAVLLELGFLSNPDEEEKLLDPEYRSELLDAVVRALLRYYAVSEHTIEIADR